MSNPVTSRKWKLAILANGEGGQLCCCDMLLLLSHQNEDGDGGCLRNVNREKKYIFKIWFLNECLI